MRLGDAVDEGEAEASCRPTLVVVGGVVGMLTGVAATAVYATAKGRPTVALRTA